MRHQMTIASRRPAAVALGSKRLRVDIGAPLRPVQTLNLGAERHVARQPVRSRGQPACWIDELREPVIPLTRVKPRATNQGRQEKHRRRWQRYPACVEVNWGSAHNFFAGLTADISDGGLFVATQAPWEVGERLEVRFRLAGHHHICTAQATVCWVRLADDEPGLPPGMGLRFDRVDPRDLAAIRGFTAQRQPILYEV